MKTIARYIPQGSTEIRREGLDAVVYCTQNANGGIYAIAYAGKAGRASFNYRFRTADARAQYINEFFTNVAAKVARRAQRAAERKAITHTLKVGDILTYSWGYDQTNVDFFQVVEVPSNKTVKIREIGGQTTTDGHLGMSGSCVPARDCFTGEASIKRAYSADAVSMKHGIARLWDGKPERCSWYA